MPQSPKPFFITIPYTAFDVMLMYHLMFPWWLACIKSIFTSFDVVLMYYCVLIPLNKLMNVPRNFPKSGDVNIILFVTLLRSYFSIYIVFL